VSLIGVKGVGDQQRERAVGEGFGVGGGSK